MVKAMKVVTIGHGQRGGDGGRGTRLEAAAGTDHLCVRLEALDPQTQVLSLENQWVAGSCCCL